MVGGYAVTLMKGSAVRVAAIAYVAADLLHAADHLRQARGLPSEVVALGSLNLAAALIVLLLAVQRKQLAALGATALGVGGTVGLSIVHLSTISAPFTDPYPLLRLDATSWLSVDLLLAAAAALAVTGIIELRNQATPASQPG